MMAQSVPSHEARLKILEQAIFGNPGHSSNAEVAALKELFEMRIQALEKATTIAAQTMDKRLDGMNEFRDTLRDQASQFITAKEMKLQIDTMLLKISNLETFRAIMESKASMSAVYVGYLIAAVGIILGVINLLK